MVMEDLLLYTKTMIMKKIDKFTLKEEMSNAINPTLEEWGYELLE